MGDNIGEENEAFILLYSLPESFKDVKVAMKYGKEKITTEAIIFIVRVRELELQMVKKDQQVVDGLFSKEKTKNLRKEKQNAEDKSKIKCHFCHKMGHMKKDCYSLKRKLNMKNKGGKKQRQQ